jgi:hypothetical protein
MSNMLQRLADAQGLGLPPYGMGAVLVLLLYTVQSEIRFGARARTHAAGTLDRGTTIPVSLSSAVPIFGFVLAMLAQRSAVPSQPFARLVGSGTMPGMPAVAWLGLRLGGLGLIIRLWSVLTLRHVTHARCSSTKATPSSAAVPTGSFDIPATWGRSCV